jgi:DNA-binding response OmpR family regulator
MLNPTKILLVEDDNDCVELTRQTLIKFGIVNELAVARTGEEALQIVDSFCPQVVLLDWVLPGLSGSDTLQAIKRACADTIVIVLSAHTLGQSGCSVSPDYYISKPIDPIQFMVVLKSIGRFGFNIVNLE